MIKVISFDVGGTIIPFEENLKNYGIDQLTILVGKPKEEVKEAYKEIFQKTKGNFDYLVNRFCDYLHIPRTEGIDEFFTKKYTPLENGLELADGAIDVIVKLKERGYKVILLSNVSNLGVRGLPSNLAGLVDDIFCSYELGYTKSESECYHIVEKVMGCQPSEFLHIGDTLKSDYYAPIENGWNALYLGTTDDKNVKCIKNIAEVLTLCERGNLDDKGRNF